MRTLLLLGLMFWPVAASGQTTQQFPGAVQVDAPNLSDIGGGVRAGDGVPAAGLGDPGDFYMRRDTPYGIYSKDATGWHLIGSAFTTDPADCTAGKFANAIAVNGDLSCAFVALADTLGLLSVAKGGTGNDMSASGGANQFVRQSSVGGGFTVSVIGDGDVPDTITINLTGDIGGTSAATVIGAGVIVDADVNAAAAIAWTKVSKVGSSLADLATRSAADLTNTLADARLEATVDIVTALNAPTMNALSYKLNGVTAFIQTGNYNRLADPGGTQVIYLGNASDPSNYYDNTTHRFRSRVGGAIATINVTGFNITGTIISSGSVTAPTFNATTGYQVNGAGASGTILRGNGTNYVVSQTTYPDIVGAGNVLYGTASNTVGSLAAVAAGSYLRSGAIPVWSTLVLPNAATATRVVFATAANTWGDDADLTFDTATLTVTNLVVPTLTILGTGTIAGAMPSGVTLRVLANTSTGPVGVFGANSTGTAGGSVQAIEGYTRIANPSGSAVALALGVIGHIEQAGVPTIDFAKSFTGSLVTFTGGGQVTQYCTYCSDGVARVGTAIVIPDAYHFYAGGFSLTAGITNRWAFYAASATDSNYFAGQTTIGLDLAVNGGDITSTFASGLTVAPSYHLILSPGQPAVRPATNLAIDLGTYFYQWRTAHIGELVVQNLVQLDTQITMDGSLVVGESGTILTALAAADTTIRLSRNSFVSGDRGYIRRDMKFEYLAFTSAPTAINRVTNPSIEAATTGYVSDQAATITRSAVYQFAGNYALKTVFAGTHNILRAVAGEISASASQTFSVFVRRADGAAVVPSASLYTMYLDSGDGAQTATGVENMGGGWYRLWLTRDPGALVNTVVGVAGIPGATIDHYFDGWQSEISSSPTKYYDGSASYTVTRDLDGTGANDWPSGTTVHNQKQAGGGWISLDAWKTALGSGVGPVQVMWERQSATYNDVAPCTASGNLDTLYGYSGVTYGFAAGCYKNTSNYFTADATNGVRFFNRTGGVSTALAQLSSTTWTLGATATEHVQITTTAINLNDGATTYTSLTAGSLILGAPTDNQILIDTTNGLRFYDEADVLRFQVFTDGVVNVGNSAAEYLYANGSVLEFRDGATVWTSLTGGALFLGVSSSTGRVIITAADGIRMTDSADAVRTQLTPAGVLTLGLSSAEHLYANGTSLQFKDGATVYTDLTAGALRLGEVGAGKANTYISAGALAIRVDTIERIGLTSAGVLTIKDSGGAAVITLDASAGADITKKLRLLGAGSALAIGLSGTEPTTATDGDGIWIDRTGLYALDGSVEQVVISAGDGKLTWAAGAGVMDATGISVSPDASGPDGPNAYRFSYSGGSAGGLYGVGSTAPSLYLWADGVGGGNDSTVHVLASSDTGSSELVLSDSGVGSLLTQTQFDIEVGTTVLRIRTAQGVSFNGGSSYLIDVDGKISGIHSGAFASLDGTNLTGVALLASANTFTNATNTFFAGASSITRLKIGGDGSTNNKGFNFAVDAAGGNWVLEEGTGGSALASFTQAGHFSLTDSDIAHGVTGVLPTNAYGYFQPISATEGGLFSVGISDTASRSGWYMFAVIGDADPTDTVPAIILESAKKNGTSYQALGSLENVLRIRNNGATLVTVLGSGFTGFGTSTPSTWVSVNSGAAGNAISIQATTQTSATYNFGIESGGKLLLQNEGGTDYLTVSYGGYMVLGTASIADGTIFTLTDADGSCTHNPESGAVTVSCSSDERGKKNIRPAPSILPYLSSLPLYQYEDRVSNQTRIGTVAQYIVNTHTKLVTLREDGSLAVALPDPWELLKGIQELTAELLAVRKELEQLKRKEQ